MKPFSYICNLYMNNMKTIKNKLTEIPADDKENLKYSDLLGIILNRPIPEGITFKQMKADLAIFSKTEGVPVGAAMKFTDEEIEKIKTLAENHLWGARHTGIIEFGEFIESL